MKVLYKLGLTAGIKDVTILIWYRVTMSQKGLKRNSAKDQNEHSSAHSHLILKVFKVVY